MTTTEFGRVITVKSGAEGPRHDPYDWEELSVQRPNGLWCYRTGALGYIEISRDGGIMFNASIGIMRRCDHTEQEAIDFFARMTGLTPVQWLRTEMRLSKKCPLCGAKGYHLVDGYPGEEMIICDGCENVIGNNFNDAAII